MAAVKIAITMDQQILQRVDAMVARKAFANRSRAIQAAVSEQLQRLEGSRLAAECAKLDPQAEKEMAEEGMTLDSAAWPKY
jgi:Arc/MetJ-type ribon-helix-helix transcriptional regulator